MRKKHPLRWLNTPTIDEWPISISTFQPIHHSEPGVKNMLMLWINCAHILTLASFETIWTKSRVIIFLVFLLLKVKQLGKVKVKTFKWFGKVFGNAPLEGHCRHRHWRRWKKGWLNIACFVIAVLQQVQLQTFPHCFKVVPGEND